MKDIIPEGYQSSKEGYQSSKELLASANQAKRNRQRGIVRIDHQRQKNICLQGRQIKVVITLPEEEATKRKNLFS